MRGLLTMLAALLAIALLMSAAAFAKGGRGGDGIGFGYGKDVRYARALQYCSIYKGAKQLSDCYSRHSSRLSRQAVGERAAADRRVRRQGGRLAPGQLPRADALGRPPLRGAVT